MHDVGIDADLGGGAGGVGELVLLGLEVGACGDGAGVLDRVVIEDDVLLAAGSVVPPRMEIPPGVMVSGVPATTTRPPPAPPSAGASIFVKTTVHTRSR